MRCSSLKEEFRSPFRAVPAPHYLLHTWRHVLPKHRVNVIQLFFFFLCLFSLCDSFPSLLSLALVSTSSWPSAELTCNSNGLMCDHVGVQSESEVGECEGADGEVAEWGW